MLSNFVKRFLVLFPGLSGNMPWNVLNDLEEILSVFIRNAGNDYLNHNGILVHKSAAIEQNVVLKPPVIVGKNSVIGANAYFRGPVFLDEEVKIGPGCEIKQSMIFSSTAIAHFNYIGNSIIGSNVNFEAGSVAANHFNERSERKISVLYNSQLIDTGVEKFGTLAGDGCRIGANAVLSPGTILTPGSIVGRLQLVDQLNNQ